MEFIDEHPVVSHRVRFKGRAEFDQARADLVRDDMVVLWLVRARSLPPGYFPTKRDSDERYRFNVQEVEAAIPLAGAMLESAAVYLEHHDDGQSYIAFDNPGYIEGSLFDYSAQYQVDQLARWIAKNDVHVVDGESSTETILRLLDFLVDRLEDDGPPDEEEEPAPEPEPPPPAAEIPAETSDPFAAVDARFAEPDEPVVVGSIYGDHQPSWMKEKP